jgi:histidyl-tRNA synthetase
MSENASNKPSGPASPGTTGKSKPKQIQSPTGTRDFYPSDLLRRRYVEKLWRDTSIRHGFEEIDGPTFEHAELYKVKSGEGILAEMFGVFSGKDEASASMAAGGGAPYALRAEFTPTLARMYAAKAATLGKPTKWFWMQNCYRAERPQRGRLREFGQWNCDVIGGPQSNAESAEIAEYDSELIACMVGLLEWAGLRHDHLAVHVSDRRLMQSHLIATGVPTDMIERVFALIDGLRKVDVATREADYAKLGVNAPGFLAMLKQPAPPFALDAATTPAGLDDFFSKFGIIREQLRALGLTQWAKVDMCIARGLAYYTGMVFEVLAQGERAVAGGGRYDNLIELFGGPPTPAVGFGMGDVVLSNLLADRNLLPDDAAIMDFLSTPGASYRPEVFVIAAGTPETQEAASKAVRPLVALLRRGKEAGRYLDKGDARKPWDADRYELASGGVPPMHARHSYKTTKNIGKLLQDATAQRAKFAVILESGEAGTIKDLTTGEQDAAPTPIGEIGKVIAARLRR